MYCILKAKIIPMKKMEHVPKPIISNLDTFTNTTTKKLG
jgi:hypothetical protein